jgi:hypothetical protein
MRPQEEVEMVGHEAIASQSHRDLFMSLSHEVHECRKVIVLVKDVAATIAPIQDMVDVSAS